MLGHGGRRAAPLSARYTAKLPGNSGDRLHRPRSWTGICGCLCNKLRGLGTFEWRGDNADGLSVLCHAHNCCLALCGTGVQSFYKFNCALMSVNLRQADVIWEPDRPVRRAEERDRGLPKEKQTHGVTPQFRRRRAAV